MKKLLFTLLTFSVLSLQARTWTPDEVKGVIRKVNAYWQSNNPAEVRSFWDNAAYHTGNMEVYKLLQDKTMLDHETGLYFRDGKYVYPKHQTASGKKDFWARGDGWVLAGWQDGCLQHDGSGLSEDGFC